eukprot:scaffold4234_cov64-Phaeocystis_antarctica.AAC.3
MWVTPVGGGLSGVDIIPEIGRRWKLVAVHVLRGEVTKTRPAEGWTCLMISCKAAPAWARSPSAVGRCPLTREEEEAPDWIANSPKGTRQLKLHVVQPQRPDAPP